MNIREMQEKRERLVAEASALLDRAESESRDLTGDEDAKFEALHEEADLLLKMADRRQKQDQIEKRDVEREERQRLERARLAGKDSPDQRVKVYKRAFDKWSRGGHGLLNHEERTALEMGFSAIEDLGEQGQQAIGRELRVMGTTSGGSPFGGYMIPEDFQRNIETAMLDYNGVLETNLETIRTSTGADLPWPTSNDTTQKGELLAEGDAAAEQDVVMGRVVFGAYTYSSKIVKVQRQLLQDGAFNLGNYLSERFGERLGRITAEHMVTGTGSSQPRGCVTAATDSTVNLTAAGPTYDELIDLQHSVGRAYRRRGHWLMADATLKLLRKLKDDQSNPIWNAGVAGAEPATILGRPYAIEDEMPAHGTTNNESILFGDFSRYKRRVVQNMILLRLEERYAEYLQVGFLAYLRMDADLIDAGTTPLQYGESL